MEVSCYKGVIDVSDGQLKLRAIQYENPDRPGTKYRVPYSVATHNKMNFVYGYVEIKARVPYLRGVWPSFWAQSTDRLKGTKNPDYMLEVDVFEVFDENKLTPNLIKWYSKEYDYGAKHLGKSSGATSVMYGPAFNNEKSYVMSMTDKTIFEYHTYGWEWTPTEMSMYIDRKKYATFDITSSYDLCDDLSGYHDPQALIFNNHVFAEDSIIIGDVITKCLDSLPACYYIDYCRLYQKDGCGELYLYEPPYKGQRRF